MDIQKLKLSFFEREIKDFNFPKTHIKAILEAARERTSVEEDGRLISLVQFFSRLCLSVLCGYVPRQLNNYLGECLLSLHEAGYYENNRLGLTSDLVRLLYILYMDKDAVFIDLKDRTRSYEDFMIWRNQLAYNERITKLHIAVKTTTPLEIKRFIERCDSLLKTVNSKPNENITTQLSYDATPIFELETFCQYMHFIQDYLQFCDRQSDPIIRAAFLVYLTPTTTFINNHINVFESYLQGLRVFQNVSLHNFDNSPLFMASKSTAAQTYFNYGELLDELKTTNMDVVRNIIAELVYLHAE